MALTYTVDQCETEIAAIDAEIAGMRGLPTSGTVGKTSLDFRNTLAELRRERREWSDRLRAAHNGGCYVAARRVG